ncbi:MAG: helix-turn-helix transcriptional regulator [Akkermansiaceae bacterium]|nr:helix-turn-helix transcriptional regulator [Armatimonadota bacterium]
MGYSLNHVADFGSPFQVVHEQSVDVAPNGVHPVANNVRKLLFVLYGECRHRVVGHSGPGSDVHLRPGDILALPNRCTQQYSGITPESGCHVHVVRLSFDPELLAALPANCYGTAPLPAAGADILAWADFGLREIRCLRAASDTVITETLLHLRTETERRAPGYRVRVHSLCAGLTVLFARTGAALVGEGDSRSDRPGGTGYHVGKIKTFLRSRLRQPTRLAEVAACVGLSEEHVARLFKSATGLTVFEYVRRLRISEAKSRLAATGENLSEIARHTGFSSLTVFSRNFTREAGMTPSEFRRQIARQIG